MYLATILLSQLDDLSVDLWDADRNRKRRGYQRELDLKRAGKIAKYLEQRNAIMPVAGLVNIRDKHSFSYKNGILTIPDGVKLWVVDMQHRLEGLKIARNSLHNFEMPIVITTGLSQVDEGAQFYIINTKAKTMNVNLTRRLLIENGKINLLSGTKAWEISAVRTTIHINEVLKGNPWYKRLRLPNQEKMKRHLGNETSFVSSLHHLFITGKTGSYLKTAKLLAEFWKALSEVLPNSFEEPHKYQIQRSPGIFAFNSFIVPGFMRKHKDPKDYKLALSGLNKLPAEFWKRSNLRGVSRFGNGLAAYAHLANYLEKYIK